MKVAMPERIARLDRDPRGYPIPWGVLRDKDGTAFFTVNDEELRWRAIREGRCPICGDILGKWKWFVGGALSAFHPHGWFIDLPGHRDCMRFALATCPYLAAPRWLAHDEPRIPRNLPSEVIGVVDPTMMPERPEIFVAIAGAAVEAQGRGPLPGSMSIYVRPARPLLAFECWRHGAPITLADAMPYLQAALGADWQPPGLAVTDVYVSTP